MHALLALVVASGFMPDVDKEDIRKLLAAGISEPTILEFIRENRPAAPLSIDDIAELKKAGAGDTVLNAMLEASRASDAVTRSQPKDDVYTSDPPRVVYRYPYSSTPYSYSYDPYSNYYYPDHRPYYYRPYSYPYRYPYSYQRPAYPYRYTAPPTPPPRHGVDRYRR